MVLFVHLTERCVGMLNELENSLALARNEDKDLFEDLRTYKLETELGKNQKCSREERKVLIVKSTFLRISRPAFLALGLVQEMSESLDT